MKRATRNFIDRQNGKSTGLIASLAGIDKKKLLIGIGVVAALLLIAGLYLFYVRGFRDSKKLKLEPQAHFPYSWEESYGEDKIVKDYQWNATKELMLRQRNNQTLMVSYYTLPGKLQEEQGMESGVYLLEDQALLLKAYLIKEDAMSATALVTEINNYFDVSNADTASKIAYLDSYLKYYSMYGNNKDLDLIKSMVDSTFDSNGLLKPETIDVNKYINKAYVGASDKEAALQEGGALSGIEAGSNDEDYFDTSVQYEGVMLSNIRLSLIRNLETNGFLPAGSYDRNLAIVLNGQLSSNPGLFANAYYIDGDEYIYIQIAPIPSQIDVFETLLTMRNLSEVGSLPSASNAWISSSLASAEGINHTYYKLIDESFVETRSNRVNYLILQIAVNTDNQDLFNRVMDKIDVYRATYKYSPALYMIYEVRDERNVCVAWDNLMMAVTLLN